jgi:hypothetical protein
MTTNLPVINLAEATFECTFGRGCEGTCCKNGRPLFYPEEFQRMNTNLHKFLPAMRPSARILVERHGYVSGRRRLGLPLLRVDRGWCVFFNDGCVLHRVGAAEGDKYRYKPIACCLFPLAKDEQDRWYVRQKGYKKEKWDLFCLDPCNNSTPAAESLREELALASREEEAAKID